MVSWNLNILRFVAVMENTPTAHHLTFGEPGSLGRELAYFPFKGSWAQMIFLLYRWDMVFSFPGGYLHGFSSSQITYLWTAFNWKKTHGCEHFPGPLCQREIWVFLLVSTPGDCSGAIYASYHIEFDESTRREQKNNTWVFFCSSPWAPIRRWLQSMVPRIVVPFFLEARVAEDFSVMDVIWLENIVAGGGYQPVWLVLISYHLKDLYQIFV